MRKDWATGRNFRRGWLGQLGAWAALLGFLFAATGSGMPLPAAMAAPGDAVLCHAQDGRMAAPAGAPLGPYHYLKKQKVLYLWIGWGIMGEVGVLGIITGI